MGKTHWLVKGTQGGLLSRELEDDAHFRVGLQKYVLPAPLYNININLNKIKLHLNDKI